MDIKKKILQQIEGQLIVSCQALPDEPLHSPYIMGKMALAAKLGGAGGIRANGIDDIKEIKKHVDLPIIGIIKKNYQNSSVFITPTIEEINALYNEGVDIIAMDATSRVRPDGTTIDEFFPLIKEKYPDQLFMADCSTFEEGMKAAELGFDLVGTTLSGYTEYTKDTELPNFVLLEKLVHNSPVPVVAEGGIWTPEQLKKAFDLGVFTAVVGTAITRPMEITKRFVKAIKKNNAYTSKAAN